MAQKANSYAFLPIFVYPFFVTAICVPCSTIRRSACGTYAHSYRSGRSLAQRRTCWRWFQEQVHICSPEHSLVSMHPLTFGNGLRCLLALCLVVDVNFHPQNAQKCVFQWGSALCNIVKILSRAEKEAVKDAHDVFWMGCSSQAENNSLKVKFARPVHHS